MFDRNRRSEANSTGGVYQLSSSSAPTTPSPLLDCRLDMKVTPENCQGSQIIEGHSTSNRAKGQKDLLKS